MLKIIEESNVSDTEKIFNLLRRLQKWSKMNSQNLMK